ncbi:hypothetical protein [Bradyrhizobium uaiense]|uniref:Uncharacterized protein n=1 Tax=Bradyrhizobium uaiense TaxID=2594946 RepID=A0A6P1BEQ3_9BRAD|nr:hypothetical protein [Bradyrhizobium uaiense]NEU96928.1 hypothetical protein [Bradyrhizobium uaiense]
MTTSERVVEILVGEGGYRLLPKPLKIGSLSFDFTHSLVAESKANDLVIVVELKGDTSEDVITRKVLAFTRALDVLQSRRSVTAVLTSGQPSPELVQSIVSVCRVLSIGAPTGPRAVEVVRDYLSVLLPLVQPPAVETMIDWEGDVRRAVSSLSGSFTLDELLGPALEDRESVEDVLRGKISQIIDPVLSSHEAED